MSTNKQYNTTQLNPDTTFERHVYHRDQFAHYLRWTHALKRLRLNQAVLDWGCGSGNMLEVMYRNRYKGEVYCGLDVRAQTINKANEKFHMVDWAEFLVRDLCSLDGVDLEQKSKTTWDMIICFEVIEHIGKEKAPQFLRNMIAHATPSTTILLSTPNYDENTGAAANHVINGEICEFTYKELKDLLGQFFVIEEQYGTFASQRDYKIFMNDWQQKFYEEASKYWDSNLLSNIMAPMFPEYSRNTLWVMKKKPATVEELCQWQKHIGLIP